MSQMPDKIWLHKDTKYNTGDIVCGYQYDFVQGIEDEGGIENFVKYVPANAFVEKSYEFFDVHLCEYINVKNANCDTFINIDGDKLKEDFKNYIKGEEV